LAEAKDGLTAEIAESAEPADERSYSGSGETVAVAAAIKQRSSEERTSPPLNGRGYIIFEMLLY